MKSDCKNVKLGDVIILKNGKSRPENGRKYPVYGGNGILGYSDFTNEKNIIVVGRVGAYCGATYLESNSLWLSDNAIGIENNEHSDLEFLYYLFKSINLNRMAIGGAQPLLTQGILKDIDISLPPLPVQQKIAKMLSSLDYKIENLRAQNKVLENIAQALFKRWFVDFEFPDENGNPYRSSGGKMVESELGLIPAGWRVGKLGEIATKITDGSHYSPESVNSGYPMASVKDMNEWGFDIKSCRLISRKDYEDLVQNSCKPLANDILIAKDGSFLKYVFMIPVDLEIVLLSSIAIIRPNMTYLPCLLTTYLKSEAALKMMENLVSGAVIRRIVLQDFKKLLIIIPQMQIQEELNSTLAPIYKMIWSNINKIELLNNSKNLLLPKLMKGDIEI